MLKARDFLEYPREDELISSFSRSVTSQSGKLSENRENCIRNQEVESESGTWSEDGEKGGALG
jgi:hypothetical protein